MILFSDQTGPLIRYQDGMLEVEDLNPQVSTRWKMSRGEMFRFALSCLKAAISKK